MPVRPQRVDERPWSPAWRPALAPGAASPAVAGSSRSGSAVSACDQQGGAAGVRRRVRVRDRAGSTDRGRACVASCVGGTRTHGDDVGVRLEPQRSRGRAVVVGPGDGQAAEHARPTALSGWPSSALARSLANRSSPLVVPAPSGTAS